ncbi:tigger transposable element-derived protein 6 [Biomphalaria glabrata]|nr:tigger transposable element-derived protein 6-like [Biomphalaria glabrata]
MTVLPAELENELVSHINQLEGMLFGLTRNDIRCLAYQIAEKKGLSHRFNKTEGMAGKDWFRDFKKRHNLSLRQPEATSLARSTGFNKIAVNRFFDKLESIITENKLDALRIFNTDETALSTVQKKTAKSGELDRKASVINIPVEPIPSTSNSQHDQLLVQSSSDSSTIVATSPLTSSNEPRFGATAQSSINSNYSHLELSISAYNAIPTEPDGRCFFRSICISLHEHLQLTDRDSSGVVCSLQVKIQEKALADSLRAQVVDYICKNIEHYTDLGAATLCADMPHAKFDNIFERLDSISRPNTMVGELVIIATTKLLRKPIVIMNATSNVVLKYGMNDFPSSPAVVIRFTNIGDDVGHYDCLIPSRQSKSKYIPVTAISPIPVKEKPHVKQKKKSFQSEILTSSPYKKILVDAAIAKKSKKQQTQIIPATQKKKKSKISIQFGQNESEKSQNWYCFICEENLKEDMIQCLICASWVHIACAGCENADTYTSELCL